MAYKTTMAMALLASFLVAGCGSGDTTTGAADSAAELAKKSENARPLSAADQASLSKGMGPGGNMSAGNGKKGVR